MDLPTMVNNHTTIIVTVPGKTDHFVIISILVPR